DEKPVGRRLTVQEVRKLRGVVAPSTNKGKRDLAILDSMLYLGLRRAEVAHLSLADLAQDGGRWWLILTSKGSKTRRLKVSDVLYKSLSAWLDAAYLRWHDERPAFYSVNKGDVISNTPLTPNDVGRAGQVRESALQAADPGVFCQRQAVLPRPIPSTGRRLRPADGPRG
ncbi:MAG: hypothetical protein DRJ03_26570, partial [Chloroflexi bacterium]